MSAFGLGLALVGGAMPRTAEAAAVTAFAYVPTSTQVYLQFSVDQPLFAWKMIVKLPGPGGAVVGVSGGSGPAMGASGMVSGLSPGTNHRLILKIRWAPGAPWIKVRNVGFTTNP
jgi:hypothetical protein